MKKQVINLKKDPSVRSLKLDDLGWVNVELDQDEIDKRKKYLLSNNGIQGLEVFDHQEIEEIVRVFYRDGFVVVSNVLQPSNSSSYGRE